MFIDRIIFELITGERSLNESENSLDVRAILNFYRVFRRRACSSCARKRIKCAHYFAAVN